MNDSDKTGEVDAKVERGALRRARIKLLTIIGMVFIPLALATVMYLYFPELAPETTTNQGTFLVPIVHLESLAIEEVVAEKWTLIMIGDGHCDPDCRQRMYLARQVHMALGKDVNRVHRLYLYTETELMPEFAAYIAETHPGLEAKQGNSEHLQAALGAAVQGADLNEIVLLMDPLGNLVLYYLPEQVGKPLQKDLKHLLKLSQIG
ncbi:MAG: hypothetical protein OEZ23_00070 [Gammaproteobacteria bacterium]|nr:hypothetical protein [Gammaproteobacteria bacterium]